VAGVALHFGHRLMLELVAPDFFLGIGMTGKTKLSGLRLDELGIIGAVRPVTRQTVAVGKRLMGRLFLLTLGQAGMAGETEFSLGCRHFEKTTTVPAMGGVA
jgi:hypothetical protein